MAFSSAQAANFSLQPNTLFHRIRSGFQSSPVKHSKKKCNCKKALTVHVSTPGRQREGGGKERIFEKVKEKSFYPKPGKATVSKHSRGSKSPAAL